MKLKQRVVSLATAAIMTVTAFMSSFGGVFSPVTAYAADDDMAHFTFTNTEEAQPDLYVMKSVSSALDGYSVPDQEFTFVLKWDQDGDGYLEFARNVEYFLYDVTGQQIMNADTSNGAFHTTSTGEFTLKDGQYVRFEFAGEVEYEITEAETENFIQTDPAGGQAATGVIPENGEVVNFENLYVPATATEYDETQLAVRKDVAWVNGYEVPEIDTEFTFSIKIDGEIYKNEYYTIYNSDMTSNLGYDYTDSNGQFTIQCGQTILFENIETGVDYEVEEIAEGNGWRAIGETKNAGSTYSPIVYTYFTNECTFMSVEKERIDGITGLDDEFSFLLYDDSGFPIEGAMYFLYDQSGHLIDTEAYYTDENGRFTLKAGEKALFVGLEENSGYHVEEERNEEFSVDPQDGYDGTISFDAAENNLFVNSPLSSITIEKFEENSSDVLLGGAEFTIYKLNEDAEKEEEDGEKNEEKNASISCVIECTSEPENESYEADEEISWLITVTNNGNIALTDLVVTNDLTDDVFTVDSLNVGDSTSFIVTYTVQDNDLGPEVTIQAYASAKDEDGEEVQNDSNLDTECTADPEESYPVSLSSDDNDEWVEIMALTTEDDPTSATYGTLTFTGLEPGTYKIVETKAPSGYQLCEEEIIVTVPYTMTNSEAAANHIDVNSDDFEGYYNEEEDTYYIYHLIYAVYNSKVQLLLPEAGGNPWTMWLAVCIAGLVVIGCAAVAIKNRKTLFAKRNN